MTITRAGIAGKTLVNGAASAARSVGTVTAGQMVRFCAAIINVSGADDVPVAGDLTQTAGNAVISTPILHRVNGGNCGDAGNTFLYAVEYSCLVTTGGTLTLTLAGQPAGTFWALCSEAYNGTWDASRGEAVNGAFSATDSLAAFGSGNATSAAAALFGGLLALNNGVVTTINEDGAFNLLAEEQDATANVPASFIDRIVTTGTTDAADWTYTGMDGATYNAQAAVVVVYKEAAGAGPNVSSTSSATPRRGSALTVDGTNLGATQGTKELRVGGQAQVVSSWSATQIVVPNLNGANNKSGVAVNVEIWDGGSLISNSYALTGLLPKVGWSYVDIASIAGSGVVESSPALAVGDQVEFEDPAVVANDGTWSAPGWLPSWQLRVWDSGGGGWGNTGLQILLTARLGLFDRLMRLLGWF